MREAQAPHCHMCNKQKKKGTSFAKFTLDLAFNENNHDEEHLKLPTTTLGKNTPK
jgi:hypothetical protein